MKAPAGIKPDRDIVVSHWLCAVEAMNGLRSGALRCRDLVASCLERIASRDRLVEAWATVPGEQSVLDLARIRDTEQTSGQLRGELHGLPIGVKDVIDTADMPTEYGSPIYRGHRPASDATCVARLRAAGAVVIGKTVTCEFANYPPSRTRNPHDPTRTPGGSSSGSAAAVADGHVAIALGTQTAGSVIRPAAFNGVIGFKPSYGAYDLGGVLPLAPSLDTLGVFARSIGDLSLIHAVLRDRSNRCNDAVLRSVPRIGVVRTPWWGRGETSMHTAFLGAVSRLQNAGADVIDIDLPDQFEQVLQAHEIIFSGEAFREFQKEIREHSDLLHPQMREKLLTPGSRIDDTELQRAKQLVAAWRSRLADLMAGLDVLLTPAAAGEAPSGLGMTGDPIFNRAWTALGVPCLCYPIGRGPHGMPLAVQVIGQFDRDDSLLAHAGWMAERSSSACMPPA